MKNKKFIELPSGKIINIDHIVSIDRFYGFVKIKFIDGSERKLESVYGSSREGDYFLEYINFVNKDEWKTKGEREWEKTRKR